MWKICDLLVPYWRPSVATFWQEPCCQLNFLQLPTELLQELRTWTLMMIFILTEIQTIVWKSQVQIYHPKKNCVNHIIHNKAYNITTLISNSNKSLFCHNVFHGHLKMLLNCQWKNCSTAVEQFCDWQPTWNWFGRAHTRQVRPHSIRFLICSSTKRDWLRNKTHLSRRFMWSNVFNL